MYTKCLQVVYTDKIRLDKIRLVTRTRAQIYITYKSQNGDRLRTDQTRINKVHKIGKRMLVFVQHGKRKGGENVSNNAVYSMDGIEVYENKIYQLADEYISSLDNPDMIYNSTVCSGMFKYINIHLFKKDYKYTYEGNTTINIDDIDLLNKIWDIYIYLNYKYKRRPSLIGFSTFTGIHMHTFLDWKEGRTRKATPKYSASVKNWLSECEEGLFDGAVNQNSIGCIFGLKANYGYNDSAPVKMEVVTQATATPQQIAERHAGATMPELPDLD